MTMFLSLVIERVKLVGSLSRLNSSIRLLKQSVVSDPLSKKAYVIRCLLLPGPLTFTGTTLKQTVGRPPITALAGTESLDAAKVLDSVTRKGLDSAIVVAVPPTEVWLLIDTILFCCRLFVLFTIHMVKKGMVLLSTSWLTTRKSLWT